MYLLYTAPLAEIIRGHGLDSHIYADDTQLYISFKDCDVDVARLRVDSIMTRQKVRQKAYLLNVPYSSTLQLLQHR